MSSKRVVLVVKTGGLEFDDRVRKISLSLISRGFEVELLAYEVSKNQKKGGSVYHSNIVNKTFKIGSASYLPKFKLLHMLELGARCFLSLWQSKSSEQVVWLNDPIMVTVMPYFLLLRRLGVIQGIIWDQHELPIEGILKRKFLRKVFAKFIDWSDVTIEANQQRLDYIKEKLGSPSNEKGAVLENYCHESFAFKDKGVVPKDLNIVPKSYFLLQSGGTEYRHFSATVQAVMSLEKCFPMVVLGRVDDLLIKSFKGKYGRQFEERFIFVGMVPQLEILNYLDNALASVILYKKSVSANNWLCAPNRLFQAINRGVPVIVGNNPPMQALANNYPNAIVLNDDGTDVNELAKAIQLMESRSCIKPYNSPPKFLWESQEDEIERLVMQSFGF